MYKLKKGTPFKGTYVEPTYTENVTFVDGVGHANSKNARDALLLRGYVDATNDVPVIPKAPVVTRKGKWKVRKGVEKA